MSKNEEDKQEDSNMKVNQQDQLGSTTQTNSILMEKVIVKEEAPKKGAKPPGNGSKGPEIVKIQEVQVIQITLNDKPEKPKESDTQPTAPTKTTNNDKIIKEVIKYELNVQGTDQKSEHKKSNDTSGAAGKAQ